MNTSNTAVQALIGGSLLALPTLAAAHESGAAHGHVEYLVVAGVAAIVVFAAAQRARRPALRRVRHDDAARRR